MSQDLRDNSENTRKFAEWVKENIPYNPLAGVDKMRKFYEEYYNAPIEVHNGGRVIGRTKDMLDAIKASLATERVYHFYGAKPEHIDYLREQFKELGWDVSIKPIEKDRKMFGLHSDLSPHKFIDGKEVIGYCITLESSIPAR